MYAISSKVKASTPVADIFSKWETEEVEGDSSS